MQQTDNKKNNIKKIISTVFLVAAVTISVNVATNSFNSEANLEKEIKKFNKDLPQQMDEFTRLDSVKMPAELNLAYYITVDIDKEEADYESIKQYIHPNILNNIKHESSLKYFRKKHFTWSYYFYDKNRILFHEYIITPYMYDEKPPV
ncbi:MAG TPA: hypothetical protein DIT04_11145 [Dysgonomonas sp.]|nr:hypothetical protein [Dysgonomonas sp.]